MLFLFCVQRRVPPYRQSWPQNRLFSLVLSSLYYIFYHFRQKDEKNFAAVHKGFVRAWYNII